MSERVDEENYDYEAAGQEPGRPVTGYEGQSDWKVRSDAQDFHVAIQRAAKAAAADAPRDDEGNVSEQWYEISRVRIKIGNPNVKVFSVLITPTKTDDD